jgi:hypothetical protein
LLLQSEGPAHWWPSGTRQVRSHEPLQQLALLAQPVPSGRQGPASWVDAPVVPPLLPEPFEPAPPPELSPPELDSPPELELALVPSVPGPAVVEALELEVPCCEPEMTDCVQAANASAAAAASKRSAPAALKFRIVAIPDSPASIRAQPATAKGAGVARDPVGVVRAGNFRGRHRMTARRLFAIGLMLGAALGSACLQVVGRPLPGIPPCCTPACVKTVVGCQLFPPGSPDYTCFNQQFSGADTDAGAAVAQYASEACTAGDEGAEVGCIAQKFPGQTCADIAADAGGPAMLQAIDLACPGGFSPGACDAACVACEEQCGQVNVDCNAACLDAGSFYGCLGCNAACNQAQAKCGVTCKGK